MKVKFPVAKILRLQQYRGCKLILKFHNPETEISIMDSEGAITSICEDSSFQFFMKLIAVRFEIGFFSLCWLSIEIIAQNLTIYHTCAEMFFFVLIFSH